MGYKLAGCDYLGGVELDPAVGECYKRNLSPKYYYNEDVRHFLGRDDLPRELYQLDILDGSPPCTLFTSNRGQKREESWGKVKEWREGTQAQSLDDLPFVWADIVGKLRPKVCLMENVEGMVKGNAKRYLYEVGRRLDGYGYECQAFILDASFMGVPQRRRRLFVIGHRKDIQVPLLKLHFTEQPILFGEVMESDYEGHEFDLADVSLRRWKQRRPSDILMSNIASREPGGKKSDFSTRILHSDEVAFTITTGRGVLFDLPRRINDTEIKRCGTWPMDYDNKGAALTYLIGMSVPPVMTAQIAHQIAKQWFNK